MRLNSRSTEKFSKTSESFVARNCELYIVKLDLFWLVLTTSFVRPWPKLVRRTKTILSHLLVDFFQDLDEKLILIVHEAEDERLYETWSEMKALEGTQVVTCHCTDLISVCTKETFLLIFLDMSSVAGNAQKICSTIRWVQDKNVSCNFLMYLVYTWHNHTK